MTASCPNCDAKVGAPFLHRLAATWNTLCAAQCPACGKFSIVLPSSLPLLGSPEIVLAPIAFVVWFLTQNLRWAAQWGVLGLVVVFCLTANYASLVAFVPEDANALPGLRKRTLLRCALLMVVVFALTWLIPVKSVSTPLLHFVS